MSIIGRLPPGARVCVIRLRSMGDCVLTTPALALLKQARPDCQIGIAVESRFASLFEENPSVSRILEPSWRSVRHWKPHLCLNLHGGSRSIWMTLFSGAKWRAGFAHHRFTLAYNLRIGRAPNILGVRGLVHTAEHLASAVFALGVPITNIPRTQLHAGESPVRGRYAVLHPFAS